MANQNRISPSALISQILKSHQEWGDIAPKIGLVPVQKETFKDLLDSISEDVLRKVAIRAADKFMDKIAMITGKIDLEGFLIATRLRIEKSGFVLREFADAEGNLQLLIKHGMGRTWSLFFCTFHERIVNNLGYSARFEIMDDSSILTIGPRTTTRVSEVEPTAQKR